MAIYGGLAMMASNVPSLAKGDEALAQSEVDAVRDAQLVRRSPGDGQCRLGDIDCHKVCPWLLSARRNCQTAGAGSDVDAARRSSSRVAARYSVTTNSDSGRGISTSGQTVKVSEKNSLRPTR